MVICGHATNWVQKLLCALPDGVSVIAGVHFSSCCCCRSSSSLSPGEHTTREDGIGEDDDIFAGGRRRSGQLYEWMDEEEGEEWSISKLQWSFNLDRWWVLLRGGWWSWFLSAIVYTIFGGELMCSWRDVTWESFTAFNSNHDHHHILLVPFVVPIWLGTAKKRGRISRELCTIIYFPMNFWSPIFL